jgi:hypothetical protein
VIKRGRAYEHSDSCSHLHYLLVPLFAEAFPIWERHKGAVPAEILLELDQAGDWPRGTAAAAMKRLSRSAQLRNQLRKRRR